MKNKIFRIVSYVFVMGIVLFVHSSVMARDCSWATTPCEVCQCENYANIGLNPSICSHVCSVENDTKNLYLSFYEWKDSTTNYISNISFQIYPTYDSKLSACSGKVLYEDTSTTGYQYHVDFGNNSYNSVCLKVTSVPDIYTVPSDSRIVSSEYMDKRIGLDRKIIVDDTMANTSLLLIGGGIVGASLGGYVIYQSIRSKKNNSKGDGDLSDDKE